MHGDYPPMIDAVLFGAIYMLRYTVVVAYTFPHILALWCLGQVMPNHRSISQQIFSTHLKLILISYILKTSLQGYV